MTAQLCAHGHGERCPHDVRRSRTHPSLRDRSACRCQVLECLGAMGRYISAQATSPSKPIGQTLLRRCDESTRCHAGRRRASVQGEWPDIDADHVRRLVHSDRQLARVHPVPDHVRHELTRNELSVEHGRRWLRRQLGRDVTSSLDRGELVGGEAPRSTDATCRPWSDLPRHRCADPTRRVRPPTVVEVPSIPTLTSRRQR
jgi:hypothetical protein